MWIRFWLVLGQSTALYSLQSSCFKMASDRAKWSDYIRSYISSTETVNTTPFCDGTQPLVPLHQVIILGARVIVHWCWVILKCNSKVMSSHTSF